MRALVYDAYGPPESLRIEELTLPVPGPGQVLVKVCAASVNSWDWDLLVGRPLGRVTAPLRPSHRVLGADISGIVEAVGTGTQRFKIGDAVFGDLCEGKWGGFADYVCAEETALALKPEAISFEQAAALPQAGLLAMQGLRLRSRLAGSDRLLINGAGGGVGTFAIQLAKRVGVHVTAVDRHEKGAALLALGADRFIDYRQHDFTRTGDHYDMILDVIGHHSVFAYRRALADGGNLALVGGSIDKILGVAALGRFAGRGRSQHMQLLIYRPSVANLDEIGALCAAGTVMPVIDSIYSLEQGATALRRLGDGHHIGKVLITP